MSLLKIENLSVSLSNKPVLCNINLSVSRGELIGLIGPNGAGKSTLLKSIVGLISIEKGIVSLKQKNLHSMESTQRAREIAYLAQGQIAHWPLTVERVVALGRFPHMAHWQSPSREDQVIIDRAMLSADVKQFHDQKISNLSGGERMRVLLARALAVRATLLLADEPIASLDPAHALSVMQLLRSSCKTGDTVITVLHDLTLAARYCHHLILMDRGTVIASGSPAEVLTSEHLKQVYNIETYCGEENELLIVPWNICK